MDNIENNQNDQANFNFAENIFGEGDFGNEEIPNIIIYDNNFDIDINVLIPIIHEVINEEADPRHIICEMNEEVPLRKKPRLHFTYEDIEP